MSTPPTGLLFRFPVKREKPAASLIAEADEV